jgi:hypothetical protein
MIGRSRALNEFVILKFPKRNIFRETHKQLIPITRNDRTRRLIVSK